MGLLDYADTARKKLAGLLGEMPLVQMAQGRAEMPTMAGVLGALKSMPVFSPDAGQSAYEAALNIGPMGLGKIVYHGSPHKFDKFDASKIGTGEGAQAYGHGVYVADSPNVANSYTGAESRLSPQLEDVLNAHAGDRKSARAGLVAAIDGNINGGAKVWQPVLNELDNLAKGQLYKADLPDEWIPKMLDWDRPLKEQSKEVQGAIAGLTKHDKVWARSLANNPNMKGEELYKALSNVEAGGAGQWNMPGNNAGATNTLNALGIPGIRYLDGGSRGKGQGSYNYVVFPGLEDQVKILERNGVPLSGLLGGQ